MAKNWSKIPIGKCINLEQHETLEMQETLDSWKPVSFNSQKIQNLIDTLRKQHNSSVLEFCTSLTQINKEIASDIRIKSHELKNELNVYRATGYNTINNLQSCQDEIFNFDESEFFRVKLFCRNLIQQGKYKINKYNNFLQDLEISRAKKLKIILNSAYMKIQKCSYKLPYEMQLYFEQHLMHLNQMLLANMRNYKELQFDLKLTFINDIKLMLYDITKYESQWREICKNEIFERLENYDIQKDEYEELWRNNTPITTMLELVDKKIEKVIEQKQIALQLKEIHVEEWCQYMQNIIYNIDESTESLINLYSSTIDTLGTNDFAVADMISKLLEIKIIESSEFERCSNISVKPSKFSADLINLDGESPDSESYEKLWETMLQNVLTYLRETYSYLHYVFHSWDEHLKRVDANKLHILNNLEQITVKNDTALQTKHEKTLNKTLNTLRQVNETALQKILKQVQDELNKMKHVMYAHREVEKKNVNKFYESVRKENEMLVKELKEILSKAGNTNEYIYTFHDELRNDKTAALCEQLQPYEQQFMELKQCKNRLRESLAQYITSSLNHERNQATLWITAETEKLSENFENKMFVHEQRYDNIRLEVYSVRLRDINEHSSQFDAHKTNTDQRVLQLKKNIRDCNERFRPEIDKMAIDLKELTDNSKNSRFSAHASTFLKQGNRIIDEKIQFLKEQINSYQHRVHDEMDNIVKGNDNYRLQISSFSTNGNYSTKEASVYSKKIQQLDTQYKKKFAELKEELSTIEKLLIIEIHQSSPPFIKLLENILNTLHCHENFAFQLMTVQNALKNEARIMKYKRKIIDAINTKIRAQVGEEKDCNDFSNAEFVIKYLKELIVHCNEHKDYLEQTDVQFASHK